jgi:poly-gamma-glutamate capsule biosynthesis protein CapA/YwtB (metallophosphatase superfamily)
MSYTLVATGDFMLQKPILRPDARSLRQVLQLFHKADHAFINLEQALTDRGEPADKLVCLRAHPHLVGEIAKAGIDVATIANNHAMDFGLTGMRDTLGALRGAGVACVGTGEGLDESFAPAVLEAQGLTVAFLGISCTLANGVGAGMGRPGLAPVRILTRYVIDHVLIQETPGVAPFVETFPMPGDVERAIEAVAAAKRQADLAIVGIHWGVPIGWVAANQDELATYQRPLGHALIDAGADAVIGHHPHVLHGIELYKERPIFYSLGNFLFHRMMDKQPLLGRPYPAYSWRSLRSEVNRHGGVARLRWTDASAAPAVQFVPVWLDDAGEPMLADDDHARAAFALIAESSAGLGTRLKPARSPKGLFARVASRRGH